MRVQKLYLLIPFFVMILFSNCINKEIESSKYSWIHNKNYPSNNVERIRVRGQIPAPEVQIKSGSEKYWIAIDLSQPNLILKKVSLPINNFSPVKMFSKMERGNDFLFEVGNLKNVNIFGKNYSKTQCYLLKQSSKKIPFKGFLGRQYFQDKKITVDFKNSILAYSSQNDSIKNLNKSYPVQFYFKETSSGREKKIYFKGKIDTFTVLMTINSCIRNSRISPFLVDLIQDSQIKQGELAKIEELEINKLCKKDITAQIDQNLRLGSPSGDKRLGFSVGLDLLREYLFTIDIANRKFYLETPVQADSSINK